MMKKLDKTKENLKVNAMSADSRKELFHKFVEAGGKITNEADNGNVLKKSIKTIPAKTKQADLNYRHNTNKKNLHNSPPVKIIHENKKPADHRAGVLESLSNKILIRLKLYFLNVTDFSSSCFNIKFLHLFTSEYKTSLMGMRLIYLEIFEHNEDLANHIKYKLEKINPVNLQLIEGIAGLYNEGEVEKIIEGYLNSPETAQPIESIMEPLLSIFRKVYLLKPYEHNIFTAFERSLEYYITATKKKSSEFSLKRKNLKNDIYIIFEKLFPSLYWLFCKYHNKKFALGSAEIEAILKTKAVKKDGYIKKNITESAAEKNKNQTDENQIPENGKDASSGEEITNLAILSHYTPTNINALRVQYDKSDIFSHVKNNDKMLYIYLIFQEFDTEYSFLLTTNKIKFKFDYMGSGYINFKEKFLDLYDNIKNNIDLLKEYAISYDIFLKVQSEIPFTNDRYIAHTKEVSTLEQRRIRAASSAKHSILNYMTEVSNILRPLTDDMKGPGKIIDNPKDIFSFEIAADANKKLNHKTISESVFSAFKFANAFIYKLSNGDLIGELEFKEPEKEKLQTENKKNIPQKNSGKDEVTPSKNGPADTVIKESIMDELDKIIDK
jgi:hypothetical protein